MKNLLLSFVLLSNICLAQSIDQANTFYAEKGFETKIEKAQELIHSLMIEKNIPGLSICLATKDKIIWAQGFGYAGLENNVPVSLQSKFRIGSISKTVTALALGKLIEGNKISLSDPVHKYVSYYPQKKNPITIYELASHTGGIRHYNYDKREFLSDKAYNSIQESISVFKDDTLSYPPGTKYLYTTYGYVLLSAVIEGAANDTFLTYMHDSVFAPIGMKNTVPDYNDSIIPWRVRFYSSSDGKIVNAYHVNNSNKWAGGGFLSTPVDLIRMSQSLLNHEFLSTQTLQKFWTEHKLKNGENTGYGVGWKIGWDSLQRKFVFHGGSSIGGRSFLMVYPKEEWAIAITSNILANFDQEFVSKITDLFMENTVM